MKNSDPDSQKLIFSHVGSLYKKRNPENLVLAIRNIVSKNLIPENDILFQFIGNLSDDLSYVQKIVIENGLQDIIKFFPPVNYDKSFDYMANSDILILLQPGAKLMLPAKFFDYICFGKPIMGIGEKNSEVEKIVTGRFGLFSDCDSIKDIEKTILDFVSNQKHFYEFIPDSIDSYNFKNTILIFEAEISRIL